MVDVAHYYITNDRCIGLSVVYFFIIACDSLLHPLTASIV